MENIFLIEKFLTDELNLSAKEVALYLNLVKYGGVSILELSEISGINRATTHVNVENLTQKGLVTQIKKGRGSRRLITAEPPEKLPVIFKERKAKLEAAENQLGFIIQEISNLKRESRQSDGMEIRRYSGKEEVKLIYDDVLKANEIRTYANTANIIEILPHNIQKFIDAHRKNHDMYVWEIMQDTDINREYAKKMIPERFFYLPITENLMFPPVDYLIFDKKIAVIDALNGRVNGIVIENEGFYEISKAIHKFVWNYFLNLQKAT
jgi:sugar-specific transcriptional regulator TrmB